MSADSFDDFPYETDTHASDAEARRHYWAVATIGLQAVWTGWKYLPYLRPGPTATNRADYAYQETGELIRAYHGEADGRRPRPRPIWSTSASPAEMLEAGSFVFAPGMLSLIHRALFQDLDAETYRPGKFKTERLVKQEDILNGDSVLYADPAMIQTSLDYLFREEGRQSYGTTLSEADVARLAQFIAFLWQVHPFVEGNTRTVAVFSELYLGSLGFTVGNEPFQKHARYYRDALVRANYRNNEAGILPERKPLEAFYENLLLGAEHALNREALLCPELFDNPQLLKHIDPSRALRR